LTRRLNDVVNENTVLVQKLNDRNARPIAPLATTNAPTQNENFELNAQLRETEQNLTHEREQVVKAMAQAVTYQKQNEQLKRLVQQLQHAFAQQKQEFAKQFDLVSKQNRNNKIEIDQKSNEIDSLKSTIEMFKQELDSKNSLLNQTKAERNQFNMESKKMELGLDATKLEVLTQHEQNAALKQQLGLAKHQSTTAEKKMMELNVELARQTQIKDEMAMKLRELEGVVAATVNKEVNLGIKERQLEQLAEDYRLEINELKAKLTNMAYQSKQLKEQNQSLMSEMGDKVRESVENAKDAANEEITKCRNEMDLLIQKEAKLSEDVGRAKREKRAAENALEEMLQFRAASDDRNLQLAELNRRLGEERRARDTLTEQIRKLHQKNDELRDDITRRESQKAAEIAQLECDCSKATYEMEQMRKVLASAQKENSSLSANLIRDQSQHDKQEATLKEKISQLEEALVTAGIKFRGANTTQKNSKVIRELQEELANTRTQLSRWKTEAIQVAQEADTKLRQNRQDKQSLTIANNELQIELKEQLDKSAEYARRLTENERDRAQLTARISTLQQKLKPFLASS